MSLLTLLAVLFIGLKLAGIIAWSWWLVLAPLWAIPAVLLGGVVVGTLAAIGLKIRFKKR